MAPVGREVLVDGDRALFDQRPPEVHDFLLDRAVERDLPAAVRLELVGERPGLPEQRLQDVGVVGGEVGQVLARVSLVQRHRVGGELRPGGGHRQVVLLQHRRLVHEPHRPDVLGHGVDSTALRDLVPGPGGEVALVLRHVLGDVHEVVGADELRQVVELDLGHVRPGAAGQGRGELGVESATRAVAREAS